MPYAKLLNQLIEESGMTAKDVAQKCADYGVSITPSYLSMLRNGAGKRMPSDDVSRAIAKALGKDENLLIVERALDEAPEAIAKAIQYVLRITTATMFGLTGNDLTPEMETLMDEQIQRMPLSESVLQLAQQTSLPQFNKDTFGTLMQSADGSTTVNVTAPPEFVINTDAMSPTICKGDRVRLQAEQSYKAGDIIAFQGNGIECRRMEIVDGHTVLVAFERGFDSLPYNPEKHKILGRVLTITRDIK